jgi:hypothetical protein
VQRVPVSSTPSCQHSSLEGGINTYGLQLRGGLRGSLLLVPGALLRCLGSLRRRCQYPGDLRSGISVAGEPGSRRRQGGDIRYRRPYCDLVLLNTALPVTVRRCNGRRVSAPVCDSFFTRFLPAAKSGARKWKRSLMAPSGRSVMQVESARAAIRSSCQQGPFRSRSLSPSLP